MKRVLLNKAGVYARVCVLCRPITSFIVLKEAQIRTLLKFNRHLHVCAHILFACIQYMHNIT